MCRSHYIFELQRGFDHGLAIQGSEGLGHIRLYRDIATMSSADSLPSKVALK